MEKLIKIIIILFIIIVVLICGVLYLLKKNDNSSENEASPNINSEDFEITSSNELKEVESTNVVLNVKQCIQYYIDYINDNNYEAIMKVLDENYIKVNDITEESIEGKSSKFIKSRYFIDKTYEKDVTVNQIIYFIYGRLVNSETYEDIDNVNFTVIIDSENQAFSVIPEVIENSNFNYNLNIKYDNDDYYNEYTTKIFRIVKF